MFEISFAVLLSNNVLILCERKISAFELLMATPKLFVKDVDSPCGRTLDFTISILLGICVFGDFFTYYTMVNLWGKHV